MYAAYTLCALRIDVNQNPSAQKKKGSRPPPPPSPLLRGLYPAGRLVWHLPCDFRSSVHAPWWQAQKAAFNVTVTRKPHLFAAAASCHQKCIWLFTKRFASCEKKKHYCSLRSSWPSRQVCNFILTCLARSLQLFERRIPPKTDL